jgi:hypothetical protein
VKSKMSSKIKILRSANCRGWEEEIILYATSTFFIHSGPSLRELLTYLDIAKASWRMQDRKQAVFFTAWNHFSSSIFLTLVYPPSAIR